MSACFRRWLKPWSAAALAPLAFAGCANYDGTDADADFDTFVDTGWDTSDETDDTDTAVPADPAYWIPRGELVIEAGMLDVARSSVSIQFWSAEPALLCETTAALTGATVETTAEPEIFAWWTLTLAEGEPPCSWSVPASFALGVGAMDSRLWPAMQAHGYDPEASSLYGLYAATQAADETVYVFGVAGTEGNHAGTEAAVTSPPLPDGTYTYTGLHMLALPE